MTTMNTTEQEELITRYMPLALKVARHFTTLDPEDSRSEAMVGLCEAAKEFDPERGAFGALVKLKVYQRIAKTYNKEVKRVGKLSLDALLEPVNDDDEGIPSRVLKAISVTDPGFALSDLLGTIRAVDERLVQIVTLRAQGATQDECAAVTGISQTKISRMLMGLRLDLLKVQAA